MDRATQQDRFLNLFPNDQRRCTRFTLEVPLRIYCRSGDLLHGSTVDISESGMSAMIPLDMIVGQAVELRFQFDAESVSVQALVKNKTAFRYGFEFVLENHEREIIARGCRALAFG
jgi:PilZ domain-containing protein